MTELRLVRGKEGEVRGSERGVRGSDRGSEERRHRDQTGGEW